MKFNRRQILASLGLGAALHSNGLGDSLCNRASELAWPCSLTSWVTA